MTKLKSAPFFLKWDLIETWTAKHLILYVENMIILDPLHDFKDMPFLPEIKKDAMFC